MQLTEIQEYQNSNCEVLGLATSGVPMEELEEVNALLAEHLAKEGINYIGAHPNLVRLLAHKQPGASTQIHHPKTNWIIERSFGITNILSVFSALLSACFSCLKRSGEQSGFTGLFS